MLTIELQGGEVQGVYDEHGGTMYRVMADVPPPDGPSGHGPYVPKYRETERLEQMPERLTRVFTMNPNPPRVTDPEWEASHP